MVEEVSKITSSGHKTIPQLYWIHRTLSIRKLSHGSACRVPFLSSHTSSLALWTVQHNCWCYHGFFCNTCRQWKMANIVVHTFKRLDHRLSSPHLFGFNHCSILLKECTAAFFVFWWRQALSFCFHCAHFVNYSVPFSDTRSIEGPRSIQATDSGSVSYLSAFPNNNILHLFGPNHEGKKHRPRPKPKLTSSYHYARHGLTAASLLPALPNKCKNSTKS